MVVPEVRFEDRGEGEQLIYVLNGHEVSSLCFAEIVSEIVKDRVDSHTTIGHLKSVNPGKLNEAEAMAYQIECMHYFRMLIVRCLQKSYSELTAPSVPKPAEIRDIFDWD
jgi:hypothetical protein